MHNNKLLKYLIIAFLLVYLIISILVIINFNKINNTGINNNATQTQILNITNPNNEMSEKIDINHCSKEALISLPKIGNKTADNIIKHRPYKDIWELDKIDRIGAETIQVIKDMVVCK
ncbi:helix-hairpin-helix domain-containing protein [Clostridium sp. BNL1100]|uniref:ComEA family DNA-binding protein n=1 Tax=Clostridium sp. BNL1100 TaxID=755731 RepID=UPI00024A7A8D|nr:helix-hairpin-helix domain-containing protein [Clostridium sp. BNL1100]AEY66597.1 hypothetical protein Clo1100_2426 [Clostridium sp. BNL1100]